MVISKMTGREVVEIMDTFDAISTYSTLLAIVLRDYNAVSAAIVDFIYSIMSLLVYKFEPFCRQFNVESLIRI